LRLVASAAAEAIPAAVPATQEETFMGKYFLAWLLGVPAFVLVIVYLLFN
jgi:hypothetical protein